MPAILIVTEPNGAKTPCAGALRSMGILLSVFGLLHQIQAQLAPRSPTKTSENSRQNGFVTLILVENCHLSNIEPQIMAIFTILNASVHFPEIVHRYVLVP